MELNDLICDINEVRLQSNPVAWAWDKSCTYIGSTDTWREFGAMFLNHPDLTNSPHAYHNHYHSAEAVLSAAYLACAEFEDNYPKPILLFAMLCHDIAHNGDKNTYDYELELKAVQSMQNYASEHPHIAKFWTEHLEAQYGTWKDFSQDIKGIILNTDFNLGPLENAINYEKYRDSLDKTLVQLKMLANEADVLPACLPELGPQRGQLLALEQNNPGIASWKSRQGFLKKCIYVSDASKKLNISECIDSQLKAIDYFSLEYLDNNSIEMAQIVCDKSKEYQKSQVKAFKAI